MGGGGGGRAGKGGGATSSSSQRDCCPDSVGHEPPCSHHVFGSGDRILGLRQLPADPVVQLSTCWVPIQAWALEGEASVILGLRGDSCVAEGLGFGLPFDRSPASGTH